jgi:chromosome partitioning protein
LLNGAPATDDALFEALLAQARTAPRPAATTGPAPDDDGGLPPPDPPEAEVAVGDPDRSLEQASDQDIHVTDEASPPPEAPPSDAVHGTNGDGAAELTVDDAPPSPALAPDGEPAPTAGATAAPPEPSAAASTAGATAVALETADPTDAPAEASTPPAPTRYQARPLPRTIAIANQKGGVGKTTTAVNLGAALADLGYRVLVVDLDPQGNATTGLGINARNLTSSIYDVLMTETPMEDCVEPTAVRNLFVAPATIDLAGAEIELVPAFSRELRLRRALERLDDEYDFVLVDCPPSLGLITINGLAAVSEVLVPIQCEYYALEGLGQLMRNVGLVQSNLNPRLELSTIVLTMYDARTKLADQVVKEVRAHFGPKVCRNVVPRTVRLSEAPSFGQPISVFDPTSRGALAYRELAKEVSGGASRRSG